MSKIEIARLEGERSMLEGRIRREMRQKKMRQKRREFFHQLIIAVMFVASVFWGLGLAAKFIG